MPTYDYECESCGYSFDAFQNMSDEPLQVCPECHEPALRRLIAGGIGVIFKGSGFYINDSRASSQNASAGQKSKDSSGEKAGSESGANSGNGSSGSGSGGNGSGSGESSKSSGSTSSTTATGTDSK